MKPLTCFKAYDLRGRVGGELNADIAKLKAILRPFELESTK